MIGLLTSGEYRLLASGETFGTVEFLNAIEEVHDVHVMPGDSTSESRDPIKWFETMSIVTPDGGFWLRNPLHKPSDGGDGDPSLK